MRFFITLLIAKFGYACIRFLRIGAGFTWPGHVALTLYPRILRDKRIRFPKGVILVTGTNGKTTTTKLIRHILEEHGETVVQNDTGGNLVNGIVSSILLQMDLRGRLSASVGVFEVDEFTLPHVLHDMTPNVVVCLNLSRDQLDRYGETDTIVDRWQTAFAALPKTTNVILYQDQEEFDRLAKAAPCRVERFSIDDTISAHLRLPGAFNKKNAHAAVLAARSVGCAVEMHVHQALESFTSAYGRGETIAYKGKQCVIFLAKNPASFSHNLELLAEYDPATTALWCVLNDNIPDGRDVSWIYDIEASALQKAATPFTYRAISGTRALDMAVRLQYAGLKITPQQVYSAHESALDALINTPVSTILIFPNYSAMLQIRKILTGQSIL